MYPALIPPKTGPPAHKPGLSENLLDVTGPTEATTRVALGMERYRPRIGNHLSKSGHSLSRLRADYGRDS